MRLQLQTAPIAEPVTLAEATAQVNAFGTTHDVLLGSLIVAARQSLDGPNGMLGRALMPQTWDLLLDSFPSGNIEIPLPPLQSVTSITYVDAAGITQTLAATVYAVDTASQPGVVSLKHGQSWPGTRSERNAVTVRFVAGYASAAAVPAPIKQAMLLHIGDLFEHRERQGEQVYENPAYDNLVFAYRLVRP